MTMRSKSLEWHTHISDTILVAKVDKVSQFPPDHESCRFIQHAELQFLKSLRGGCPKDMAVRQHDYGAHGRLSSIGLLTPGDEVLAFFARDTVKRKSVLHFWINLTKPDGQLSPHGANTNESLWLNDGGTILTAVTERIAREKTEGRGRRGIITWFMPGMATEIYWDLVRTAEPEFKQEVIRDLREGIACDAICNLISYPGRETEELIRPFLQDMEAMEWTSLSHPKRPPFRNVRRTRTIYPLRHLAYIALKLLGKRVALPAGCDPGYMPFGLHGGFEDRSAFPYGGWKRVDFQTASFMRKLYIY